MDWSELENVEGMFFQDTNLKEIDLSKINMDKVTNISTMFKLCDKVKPIDLSNQNLKEADYACDTFSKCPDLEYLDISSCSNFIVLRSILDCSLSHLKQV